MCSITRTLALNLGTTVLALFTVSAASAQCGLYSKPAAFHGNLRSAQPRLLTTAFDHDDYEAGIVGMWHVRFISYGTAHIPDGTEIDAGYSVWHSDGTEILNSGLRSPITSSFCLGVWKQTGKFTYKLNHFAAGWDPTGSYLIGPGNIREQITLLDKSHYKGTFTIDQYDEKGNQLAHLQGEITGVRIEVETPVSPVE